MTAAIFKATYSDWKPVKTRRVIQVIFEVSLDNSDEAYQALGGMPDPAKERWFAIARMNQSPPETSPVKGSATTVTKTNDPDTKAAPDGELSSVPARRSFADMSPAQQAGMLCQEKAFQVFLRETYQREWVTLAGAYIDGIEPNELAADVVRHLCQVTSRRAITKDNAEWPSLVLAYRLWQREPEYV